MDQKVLIITHIDLDGYGVAIMWKCAFPDADVIYVNYNWEDEIRNRQKLLEYDIILIGDLSCRASFIPLLESLRSSGKTLMLRDHHDSAIREFSEAGVYNPDWMIIDTEKCGTLLVYEDLKFNYPNWDSDGSYKKLAETIDDYDRWIHSNPISIYLQFLWSGMDKDKFVERFINNPRLEFNDEELEIINDSRAKLNKSFNAAKESMLPFHMRDIEDKQFNYCTDVPYFLSLVAMMIQREYPELDYLVLKGANSYSLRSTKYPVNRIAEIFGGGGHPLSAGCNFDQTTDVVESIKCRKIVKYPFADQFSKA